ncbi:hypothetical protein BV25DRAFT_399056 [Artomyces pyxidatus]|uniref:Uncharacterized protein n=1 Tax=Artomyces pyxidatus TaxID=48021 RepID=A0ACB8T5C7_9AGAM|nr:hypothetical protein BV25DRAFT_399056 [Artomyces pyxidatus]
MGNCILQRGATSAVCRVSHSHPGPASLMNGVLLGKVMQAYWYVLRRAACPGHKEGPAQYSLYLTQACRLAIKWLDRCPTADRAPMRCDPLGGAGPWRAGAVGTYWHVRRTTTGHTLRGGVCGGAVARLRERKDLGTEMRTGPSMAVQRGGLAGRGKGSGEVDIVVRHRKRPRRRKFAAEGALGRVVWGL